MYVWDIKVFVEHHQKDADGNVVGCPHCGARSIHKSGFLYRASHKKQQWKCTACGRKTVAPTILEESELVARAAALEYETKQGDFSFFGWRDEEDYHNSYQPYLALKR